MGKGAFCAPCPSGSMVPQLRLRARRGNSSSEQLHELIDCETGVRDDPAQRAGSNSLVIGNNDPRIRLVAAQHHMAAGLPAEDKPDALQSGADFQAR